MANTVTLTFAGDADQLARAAKKGEQAVEGVGKSATSAGDDFQRAAGGSNDLTTRMGHLGSAVDGASTAIGDAAGTLQGLVDIQEYAKDKAARLGRALNDCEQAQNDLNQAQADGRQATLDVGQAQIDAKQAAVDAAQATKDYAEAVKEHGKGSIEARQAQLDLQQAQQDGKQSTEDYKQAQLDAAQAVTDAGSAQLDLNDAQREAHPPELQGWADQLNMLAPLLTGLVGITGLITAAQWAWNAAQAASPTTWIIVGIVALVAIIVVIATKTTWFKDLWEKAWGGIKSAASAVGSWFRDTLWGKWIKGAWDKITGAGESAWESMKKIPGKLKDAFASVKEFLFAPFRAAFNAVSSAWNNTVGRLSWTVPGWVPGVGGMSISAPQLPHFHAGGVVPGTPGSEVLAVLQAGERVSTRGAGPEPAVIEIRGDGSSLGDALVEILSMAVNRRGGNVQAVLGGRRG